MKNPFLPWLLLFPFLSNAMNYQPGDTLNVVAMDGLVVRTAPRAKSEKITVLKSGEKAIIVDTVNFHTHKDSIFGFSGHWVLIQAANDVKGYVFDAFLSKLPIAQPVFKRPSEVEAEYEFNGRVMNALERYANEHFKPTGCHYKYDNRHDGESSHSIEIQPYEGGHAVIKHGYWEGGGTELTLNNVRPSEIYYLVYQLLGNTNGKTLQFKEDLLKKSKQSPVKSMNGQYAPCVIQHLGGNCCLTLFQDSKTTVTISVEHDIN
jgi:hypothetical protein